MSRTHRRLAWRLALGTAAIAVMAAVGVSSATTVKAGNLSVSLDGTILPKKLSKTDYSPVKVDLTGSIATSDGTHVPPLQTISLKFDKHGKTYTTGLPTCTVGQLTNTVTQQALKECGDALVGKGTASAQIQFPDATPFTASGPLLIFNGQPKGGKPVLIQHVFAHVPAPTTFVVSSVLDRGSGKYGTSTVINVPPIAGGYGSLTGFEAKLDRTWTYKGRKQSFLLGICPTGHWFGHGDFAFGDGTTLSGTVIRPCTPGK